MSNEKFISASNALCEMGANAQSCDSAAIHGGPDCGGIPVHDFSTNSNACGPCPDALRAVQSADASRYPDPSYAALRDALAQFHGVHAHRIVFAASASEFIHRITALATARGACAVALPPHSYGDYLQAAQARGLQVLRPVDAGWAAAGLQWACEPASPLGTADAALGGWTEDERTSMKHSGFRVVDCAYVPLLLHSSTADRHVLTSTVWQLWTPNKALGLTGVRAAYAIAPQQVAPQDLAGLNALASSWPVGAHGVAMLSAWTQVATQAWLADSRDTLLEWKSAQQALCASLGWAEVQGSLANYFVAKVPVADLEGALARLRSQGIKLRDCSSFSLPGHVRLGVLKPEAQAALLNGWRG